MAVMEEAIEHSGNSGAVAGQFAPVVHRFDTVSVAWQED
jgi:hypothetical protein